MGYQYENIVPNAKVFLMKREFGFDLIGRVRNINLPASPANALIPLFEAISNSLHAIEDRFGKDGIAQGKINVFLKRGKDNWPDTFIIRDNGIGLSDRNMASFLTSDSSFKQRRGGKGVGRLSWLKTFESIHVSSVYKSGKGKKQREFTFRLDKDRPINIVKDGTNTDLEIGSAITLKGMKRIYAEKCLKGTNSILEKITGHFLPYFIPSVSPSLDMQDDDDLFELKSALENDLKRQKKEKIEVEIELGKIIKLNIVHGSFNKKISLAGEGHNFLFFVADKRVVEHIKIDSQLGLKSHGDDEIYIGVVSSNFLDSRTNQERTALDITEQEMALIRKAVDESVFSYLSKEISQIREKQEGKLNSIISENPQFLPFKKHSREFVENKLKLNQGSEEDIFMELSRQKRRGEKLLKGPMRRP
jgi:hypothetical protein